MTQSLLPFDKLRANGRALKENVLPAVSPFTLSLSKGACRRAVDSVAKTKKGANFRPPPPDSACLYHFKQAGCALAAADAHGDHHVLGATALTLNEGMAGQA